MEDYLNVLRKYAVFEGRARRREYWMFFLFNFIISVAFSIIDLFLGAELFMDIGLLSLLYSLAVLIPGIAVTVRRLHDTNRSAWWLLILLIPIIGSIIFLVFLLTNSTPGDNSYGPNPKGIQTREPANPPVSA